MEEEKDTEIGFSTPKRNPKSHRPKSPRGLHFSIHLGSLPSKSPSLNHLANHLANLLPNNKIFLYIIGRPIGFFGDAEPVKKVIMTKL